MVLWRSSDGRALRWEERADPGPLVVGQVGAGREQDRVGSTSGGRGVQLSASGDVAALRDGLMVAPPGRPDEAKAEAGGRLVECEQQPTNFWDGQRDEVAGTSPFSCSATRA